MPSEARPPDRPGLLVIGLGNEHRGDDGCGLEVIRALRVRLGDRSQLVEGPGDVTELLGVWSGTDRAIVVDAVRSGRPPGTVQWLELGAGELPGRLGATSTHGLTLADAISLGRSLGHLPRALTVVGIEAGPVAMHRGLSEPVRRAVLAVADRLTAELRTPGPTVRRTDR